MTEELKNKLESILTDESFAMALQNAENEEAVKKLFGEKGIELTDAEVTEFLKELPIPDETELSDEALEDVAGGAMLVPTGLLIGVKIGSALYKLLMKKYKKR